MPYHVGEGQGQLCLWRDLPEDNVRNSVAVLLAGQEGDQDGSDAITPVRKDLPGHGRHHHRLGL